MIDELDLRLMFSAKVFLSRHQAHMINLINISTTINSRNASHTGGVICLDQ